MPPQIASLDVSTLCLALEIFLNALPLIFLVNLIKTTIALLYVFGVCFFYNQLGQSSAIKNHT